MGWQTSKDWTTEEDNIIRLNAHRSARYIAELLGPHRSRNAVVGRAHRKGIALTGKGGGGGRPKGLSTASHPQAPRPPRNRKRNIAPLPPLPQPEAQPLPPTCTPVEIWQLDNETCRYPVADGPPMLFCNEPAPEGVSWCGYHAGIVFRKLGEDR